MSRISGWILALLLMLVGTQTLAEEAHTIYTWTLDEAGYLQDADELPFDTPYEVLEIVPPEKGSFIQKWTKAYLMVKIRYEDPETGKAKEGWCADGAIRPFGRNVTVNANKSEHIVLSDGEAVDITIEEWVDLSLTPYSIPEIHDGTAENAIRIALDELSAQGRLSDGNEQRYRVRCGFAAQGLGRLTNLAVPLWEVIIRSETNETNVFVVYVGSPNSEMIGVY